MKSPAISLLLVSGILALLGGCSSLPQMSLVTNDALSFEEEGAWLSVSPDLLRNLEAYQVPAEELSGFKPNRYGAGTPVLPDSTLEARAAGVILTTEHVKAGKFAGKWADHQLFPSIICERVPADWSAFSTLSVSIYSQVATGEHITVGILSDDPATAWKDWYFYSFTVDWQGDRRLEIPLAACKPHGSPAGWNQIGGIAFFTQAFGYEPIPETALWLDNMGLTIGTRPEVSASEEAPGYHYEQTYYEKPNPLNHPFPEVMTPAPVVAPGKPLVHARYFGFERVAYAYNPRFQPGYVSFDPQGRAYIRAGDRVQWLDPGGQWTFCELGPVISAWGQAQGWPGIRHNDAPNGVDPMIRFDREGDAYLLAQVTAVDETGKETSWMNRTALLLHSRDGLRTWTVYPLPAGRTAAFEKLDGHNGDCLDHPPIIMSGDYAYFPQADVSAYLTVPSKNSDGSLTLTPYAYAENALTGDFHSGDANTAISVGDMIYIVWAWCPVSGHYPAIKEALAKDKPAGTIGMWGGGDWTWEVLRQTELGKSLPPIPEDHPALDMTFKHFKTGPRSEVCYARNGVPVFVTAFDRRTKQFAPSVFVGFGGSVLDAHNWGSITVNAEGILTVLINGHHDPLTATHSLKPLDITAWSAPVYLEREDARVSYATLTCGRDGTLYSVNRSTSHAYNNALSLFRKQPDEDVWEKERILVWPFKSMYMAWSHKMSYDPLTDRLFLTYYGNGSGQQWTVDQYEFFIFQHPDQEMKLAANQGTTQVNSGRTLPYPKPLNRTGNTFYLPEMSAGAILVSSDRGETWHLATTDDFTPRRN